MSQLTLQENATYYHQTMKVEIRVPSPNNFGKTDI